MSKIISGIQALSLICLAAAAPLNAQSFNVGASMTSDPNIFDTYYPVKDRITEISLGISDWKLSENSFFGYFYSGSLAFHKNIPGRDYQLHMGMLGYRYHFKADDVAGPEGEIDGLQPEEEPPQHDSLDQFLNLRLTGSLNLNKNDYEQWDAMTLGGTAVFRQSLGAHASIRPAYGFAYVSYPNLSPITNLQHKFSLIAGSDFLPSNWFAMMISYGIKTFPIDQTDSISVTKSSHQSGGGGSGTSNTVSYNMTTPSVKQASVSLIWNYGPAPTTDFSFRYTHYYDPTAESRNIPDLRKSALRNIGAMTQASGSENELYDDPYSYRGDLFYSGVDQTLPLELSASGSVQLEKKYYTYPAVDLEDSPLGVNRSDTRTVLGIMLSRMFAITEESAITVMASFEYSKNSSNSPYFNFKKNAIMAGVEYSF